MKMTILLLILTFSTLHARSYSQNLSLNAEDAALQTVLDAIEDQSEYYFLYSSRMININQTVNIYSKEENINNVLSKLFTGTNIHYIIQDRQILLVNKEEIYLETTKQQSTVTGYVTDAQTREFLPGVTIQVKGTNTGGISQSDGTYTVTLTEGAATLIFSFVGYQTQEIDIAGRSVINVSMVEEITAMEEIVVTGYSVERKKDIIGSVSVVDIDDMLSTRSSNIASQLQGHVAGVTISSTGTPGGLGKMRVRGFGSFTGSDPLYVIDGVPSTTAIENLNPNDVESIQILKDAAASSIYGSRAANGVVIITTKKGQSGRSNVSFEAYYGINYVSKNNFPEVCDVNEHAELYWKALRGAGYEPGDPAWGHPQYGYGENPVIPEYILVNDYGTYYGGAALESLRTSNPALFSSLIDPENYDYATHQIVKASNTNWFDEVFNPAPQQNYQLNFSNATDRISTNISIGYYDEKSVATKYSYYNRFNARINSSITVSENIEIGENLSAAYTNQNLFSVRRDNGTNATSAYIMSPLIPVYDIMGNPAGSAAPGLITVSDHGIGNNPVTEPWHNRFDNSTGYSMFGNLYTNIKLIEGLIFHSSFGVEYLINKVKDFNQLTYEHYQNTTTNSMTRTDFDNNSWTFTNTLNYRKEIGNHVANLLLGSEAINNVRESISASRTNFGIEDDSDFQVLAAGTGTQTNSGSLDRNSLFSLFGRFDYTYANKYILGVTLRRDQSSKFASKNRTGYFPAVAVGWRLSSEPFLANWTWLNDLKLRASWGIIGNQTGLSSENQYNIFVSNPNESYPMTGSNSSVLHSFTQARIGNLKAKWEENTTSNVGFDAAFLNNGLTISFEYYIKKTEGLLVPEQLPLTGATIDASNLPYVNTGNIKNTGVDLILTGRGNIIAGMPYEISLTFTKYKNIVEKVLDNPKATIDGGQTREGYVNRTEKGYPISYFYGYEIEGFFNTQQEVDNYNSKVASTWILPAVGRWIIKDQNGDGRVNPDDRVYLGSPHPKFQMGLNFSLAYKNFDFTGFLFTSYGSKIYNQSRYMTDFNTFQFNRSKRMLYESWTPELGNDAKLPKLDVTDVYSNTNVSDYFLEDGSYLRLKTLQLGYNFPEMILSKLKLNALRVYVQAQNLFTITSKDFTGLDPDANFYGGGIDQSVYSDIGMGVVNGAIPTPKQVTFGLNLQF